MTVSQSYKEKAGSDNQASQDDFLEGTSARTRPLSYDEIMLKRKIRGDTAKQISSGREVADIALARENTEKTRDFPERHRKVKEDSETMDVRHTSDDSKKVSSRRKEETRVSRKNEKLIQVIPEATKLKSVIGISSNRVTEGRHERRDHSSRKKDGPFVESENGYDRRPARDSYKKGRVSERSGGKPEMDRKQPHTEDRLVLRERKTDGRMNSDSENEHKRRNARHLMQSDKLIDSGRQELEKENRHRRHIEENKTSGRQELEKESRHIRHIEEDKTRGRSTGKKTDSGIKGSESARTYLEESRPKRRRTRSREREGPSRRSVSHSPKGHRHRSKEKRDHVDLSSRSTKDRPGREQSDVEKKRLSNNGSTSHYRRNNDFSSGLGGYSPRKRKTGAAAKIPSPTRHSPEKRNAGWDLQPAENESVMVGSTLSKLQTTSPSLSLNMKEFPNSTPVTPTMVKPIGVPHHALPPQMHAIESVQLTQATRPMRRLYVDNLPASASEKDLIECINKLLMSSGVNYIQGTQPCISCIIHKEKSQDLLEFLTPEDASAALSLEGVSFSGFNLKLRRPKMAGELPETLTAEIDYNVYTSSIDSTPFESITESHQFALNISHQNYLQCKFVDQKNKCVVHQLYEKTLGEYCKDLAKDDSYLLQPYRTLIRAMISFISYIHKKGWSLADKSLSPDVHLVVQDDVLKFWMVEFRPATIGKTQETQIRDIKLIKDVICKLFPNTKIRHLVTLQIDMDNYRGAEDDNFLLHHLSITSTHERLIFFKCHEKHERLDAEYGSKYRDAVIKFRKEKNNWTTFFENMPSSADYSCVRLWYHDEMKKLNDWQKVYWYNNDNDDYAKNILFLRLCRNLTVHLKDILGSEGLKNDWFQHVEGIMMTLFEIPMMEFQKQLHYKGLMKEVTWSLIA